MPPSNPPIPSYRLHRTGQGTCRFPAPFRGKRDHYFGRYELPESREAYDRLIAEWLLARHRPAGETVPEASTLTVADLTALYFARCETHYQKGGEATGQLARVKCAILPLCRLYGSTPASDFGPKALKAVRQWMVSERDWSRNFVNSCTGCLKTLFDWAGAEELIPGTVGHSLRVVKALGKGTPGVRESKPIQPVPLTVVNRTLAELSPTVADMVRLQLLTGMRPCEVCGLRPQDISFAGEIAHVGRLRGVWIYEVAESHNKNARKGQRRIVALGPKAMVIIRPYIRLRLPDQYLFSPREAAEWYYRSKGQRINHARARSPGEVYTTEAYGGAVEKAAKRAGVPHWAPNQLRHTKATEIRSKFSPDHARVVLGHALPGVTGHYAEADYGKAAEVMRKIG